MQTSTPPDSRNPRKRLIASLACAIVMLLAVVAMALPQPAHAEIASGTSGTVSWTIGDDGALVFSPTSGDEGTFGYSNTWGWRDHADAVKSISFTSTCHGPQDATSMFADLSNMVSADLSGFDGSTVSGWGIDASGMSYMFRNCSSLEGLDLGGLDTSKTCGMTGMFEGCSSLTSLDLSSFSMGSMTAYPYTGSMFGGCARLMKVVLGSSFEFKVDGSDWAGEAGWAVLPTHGYGYWTNGSVSCSAETLRDTWDGSTMAGTWTFQSLPHYTVSFDSNGAPGSMPDQEIAPDTATALSANGLAWEHHVFKGWNTAADGSGTAYADGAEVSGPADGTLTLYAQWADAWTVTFDGNGGSYWDSGAQKSMTSCAQEIERGTSKALSASRFSKSYSDFAGWNTEADGSGQDYANGQEVSLSSDLTLYAQWKRCTYVYFYSNGGSGSMSSTRVIEGTPASLPACTFSRTNYRFAGWNTQSNGKGTAYADGADVSSLPSEGKTSVSLYAQWERTGYRMSFYSNGGSGSMSPVDIPLGQTAELPACAFTRANYRFAGWNTQSNGKGTAYADGAETKPISDMALYAQWARVYTVYFDAHGGTGTMDSIRTESGPSIVLPDCAFARDGYAFTSWTFGGRTYAAGEKFTPTTNMTLYAQWRQLKYAVRFDPNGGSGSMADQEIPLASSASLDKNAFKRDGFVFEGWNTEADGSGQAYVDQAEVSGLCDDGETITLFAQWTSQQTMASGPVFLNSLAPGTLTVTKSVAGDNPNPSKTFKIHVKLVAPSGTTLPSGAFQMTRQATEVLHFDPNGGTGTMDDAIATTDTAAVIPASTFAAPSGKRFKTWNTRADGTGTDYAANATYAFQQAGTTTLYAIWEIAPAGTVRYAVSPYGIGIDHDADGNTMGLTFGPATGDEWWYSNSSKTRVRSHTVAGTAQPEGQAALTSADGDGHAITDSDAGTDASGNAYRCIHYDNWNTIIWWNKKDPEVYAKCVAKGCSHAVEINYTQAQLDAWNYEYSYSPSDSTSASDGDGRDFIWYSKWDLQRSGVDITQAGQGYSASLVRAKLVGADSRTKLDAKYAGTDALTRYTAETCMLAAFPQELQAAIGAKDLSYADGLDTSRNYGYSNYDAMSDAGCADKLWLMNMHEAGGTSVYPSQPRTSLSSSSNTSQRRGDLPWLRSPRVSNDAWGCHYAGDLYTYYVDGAGALAPGFALSR